MPRLPEVEAAGASPAQKAAFEADIEAHGDVLNTTRIYAHAPEIVGPLRSLHRALDESDVPASLVALARLRTAQIIGCPF